MKVKQVKDLRNLLSSKINKKGDQKKCSNSCFRIKFDGSWLFGFWYRICFNFLCSEQLIKKPECHYYVKDQLKILMMKMMNQKR